MTQSTATITGTIAGIAVRTAKNGPMQELPEATVAVDGGIEGDLPVRPNRGVTFISKEQWAGVCDEMGAELPWYTRRANVLVEGLEMGALLDKTLAIGDVVIAVKGETHPCGLMDRIHQGMRKTLDPYCRGGVYGRVLQGGTIKPGDTITVR